MKILIIIIIVIYQKTCIKITCKNKFKILSNNFKDPKFDKFEERLKMELSRKDHRKILVFSEFADTAEYLHKKLLEKKFKVFKYTSKEGSKKENRKIIIFF